MRSRKSARTARLGRDRGPDTAARIELALDALEHMVTSGQADGVRRWTALLWAHRTEAVRVLVRRLQSRPGRTPGLMLDILGSLCEDGGRPLLRQVAGNPLVPDLVRLEAGRRVGWPDRGGRARAAFLASLRDAEGALCALAVAASGPVPDAEVWEETLGHLLAMAAPDRLRISRAIAAQGSGSAWLLRGLLDSPDPDTRLVAIEGLLAGRDRGALPALRRTMHHRPHHATRQAADVAIRRLALEPLGGGRAADPALAPVFARAFLTHVDGLGAQVVSVVHDWEGGAALLLQLGIRDDRGIVGVRGQMHLPRREAIEICESTTPVADVSLDQARAAVDWALQRAQSRGRLPPPAFTLWEPFLYERLRPQAAGPLPPVSLPDRLPEPSPQAVADLLMAPCSRGWQFSAKEIAGAFRRLSERSPRATPDFGEVLRTLCPPRTRRRWAERLRRQAWVLDRVADARLRDAALGCATMLEGDPAREAEPPLLLAGMLTRGLAALNRPSENA